MNVLVVTLSGLRVHFLGCYGSEWVATPAFDRLAAAGVTFDRHFADVLAVPPALRPSWVGVTHHWMLDSANVVPATGSPLRALLAAGGVEAVFPEDRPVLPVEGQSHWEQAFGRTLACIQSLPSDRPWCVWADMPSLAPPWALPDDILTAYFDGEEGAAPWGGTACGPFTGNDEEFLHLHQTYAAVVSHVDGALEAFLDAFEETPAAATTLLILTAQHGLALGEHGIVGPCLPYLHDELVHLPLLLRFPHAAEAGRHVTSITQPVDLYATVLDALGLPVPEGESQSLLPLARGQPQSERVLACTSLRIGEATEWALRTHAWAYLLPVQPSADEVTRSPQLYAKPEDAWEVNNVRDRSLERAEQMEQQLRTCMGHAAPGERHEHREAGG